MTPERYQKAGNLYHAALEIEPHARAAFLDGACGEDEELRREAESLLLAHDRVGNYFGAPAIEIAAGLVAGPQHLSLAGQSLSNYRVLSLIGAGGMGEVYQAEDTRLGRKVALKLLPRECTEDPDRVRRFELEARAASSLNHPNIVTIFEFGEVDGRHYIATEYIDGQTLRERLSGGQLEVREALDVAAQIASALKAAHEAGIVHRDIKPENVIVRPDGLVKILDFGLAKLVEQQKPFIGLEDATTANQTAKGVILGTVNYMSPEQAKGERVDERTDIFSLGVVIYEMLTGRIPFAGDSLSETFANLINAEPQPLSGSASNMPDELKRIVAKTLRKNRDERHETMKDVLTDLKDLKENLTLENKSERSLSSDSQKATAVLQATTRDVAKQTAARQYSFSQRIALHKSLAAFALSAILIGSIGLGYYFFYSGKMASGADGKKSVAVLPLKPIDTANRDEIYEIGIADSLILKLSAMKGFIVRPLSATRKYADIAQDPLAAGREQQVDYVLASNYQLAGGKIRITAQLFNVASGQIEETYKSEKDAGDVFAMQDAIAGEVGNKLLIRFATTSSSSTAKRGTTNEEAYRLYLQGMYLYDKRTVVDAQTAVRRLEQAIQFDPNYARAWAGKAYAHRALGNFGGDTHEEYKRSIEAIDRALALDANLADAHSAWCENKFFYEWDFDGAEQECKRAIELEANSARAHDMYARYLYGRGRFDEAIAEIKTAVDLEPTSLFIQRNYGVSLYYARRYAEAVTQFKRVAESDPNFVATYAWLVPALHAQGSEAEAFEWFMKWQAALKTEEETVQSYQKAYQTSGWQGVGRERVKRFDEGKIRSYFLEACLTVHTGDKDKAFEYLEKSYQRREWGMPYFRIDPSLDALRDDPRFDDLIRRGDAK